MPTWLSVTLHSEEIDDTITQVWSGGAHSSRVNGKGTRIWRCLADAPVGPEDGFTATDGTTSIAGPDDPWSGTRTRMLPSDRKSEHLNGAPNALEVTLEYTDLTGGEAVEDLLALPAKITSGPVNQTEEYAMDEDDPPKPVRNKAGEPFDNAPTRDSAGRIYTIEKYVSTGTKAAIRAQERTNNTGAVTIDAFVHGDNTLYLRPAVFEPIETFWKATLTIIYNPVGWSDKSLNVGFSEIDAATGGRKDITQKDANGKDVRVTKPWPLNSDGRKKTNTTDDIDTLEFFPYPYGDWSGVPLS